MGLSLCFDSNRSRDVDLKTAKKKTFESCEGPNLSELGVNRLQTSEWGDVEKVGTAHEATFIGHVEMLEMCGS